MRLIDADTLLENYNLKDATKYGNKDAEQQAHSYDTLMMYEIADMIEDAPTIDAVPVVRGEWLVLNGKLVKCFECSACHALNDYKTRHCPFCGADMRKGGSNE